MACMPGARKPPKKPSGTANLFGRWREKGGGSSKGDSSEVVRWSIHRAPSGTEQRCALILYGLPKSFRERSFPSLHARLISRLPFPCDVFVHTYDLRETTNARNGEVACKLDPSSVSVAHPLRVEMQSQDAADTEHQANFNEMKRYGDAWFNHFVSLRNVLRQYNSIKRGFARMEQEQLESGVDYSVVCCSRMDVLYLDDLPDECVDALRSLEPGTLFVPDFHEWELRRDNLIYPTGGMNDRFAIGCRHAMKVYADRLPACVDYCRNGRRMFHTETFLKHHLASANVVVRKMRFRFQRIRGTGQVHDSDRDLEDLPSRSRGESEPCASDERTNSRGTT